MVVDELHMVSDWSRGVALELALAKLLAAEGRVQVVGMSATSEPANANGLCFLVYL